VQERIHERLEGKGKLTYRAKGKKKKRNEIHMKVKENKSMNIFNL